MNELKRLNKYFWKYKWSVFFGIFFITLSNIAGVYPPQVIRDAFDLVKDNITYYSLLNDFEAQSLFYDTFSWALLMFGASVLLLACLKGLFMFIMRQTIIVMSRLIEFDLKNEIYNHYQKLDRAFYKRSQTGDLMSRATEDVARVRMYVGPALMYATNLTVMLIMVIGAMLSVSVKMTLYVLIPLPILSISIFYVNSIINRKSEAIQAQLSQLTSVAQESFSGIRVLKSYVQEKPTMDFFGAEAEIYKEKQLELAKVQAIFLPIMILLVGLSTIITIWVGGLEVQSGAITSGNIAEFVIYVNMLTWPVTSIGWVASIIQRAAASQKRINEFLDTESLIVSGQDSFNPEIQGEIIFDSVDFIYPDTGIHALKNVSFKINKGEKVAIVGRTGSGKSTIAELLMRSYDPQKGNIYIDNTDIKKFSIENFREQIAYVPQDVFLFSATVRNNIGFGLEGISTKEIEIASKQASVYNDILSLDNQFDTMVGERGVTLSGGQKQRISLARALVKNSNVLILDDCLSAVDAKTEKDILLQLDSILKARTSVIITHRVFSLLDFDKIIVLEEGEIAEIGTHKNLMNKKGIYFELYKLQEQESELVDV